MCLSCLGQRLWPTVLTFSTQSQHYAAGGGVSIVIDDDGLTTAQANSMPSPRGNMTIKFVRTEFLENSISVELASNVPGAFGAG